MSPILPMCCLKQSRTKSIDKWIPSALDRSEAVDERAWKDEVDMSRAGPTVQKIYLDYGLALHVIQRKKRTT